MKSTFTLVCVVAVFTIGYLVHLRGNAMPEIKFDLGKNIVTTAKNSGAPRYATRNIDGWISYKIINLQPEVSARYARPGFEIVSRPLFAFTLYADEQHNNGSAVEKTALAFFTGALISHESAQGFVEQIISQFQKGQWRRHIDEACPAVTGRSSFLNEAGQPEQIGACPLDPAYRLQAADWVRLMRNTQNYQWIGDGVLATLTVGFSDDTATLFYSIDLEFEDFAIKKRRSDADIAQTLASGDAQGHDSTETAKQQKLARKIRVQILEENARLRGDKVVER